MTQRFIEKILTLILITVIITIALVTLIVFTTSKDSIGLSYRKSDPSPQKVIRSAPKENLNAYTEIGEIRTVTKPEENMSRGSTVLLKPWFSYEGEDKSLYEELVQKNRLFTSMIAEYFTKYTRQDLKDKGEDNIKSEIKNLINDQLVLGRIREVFFEQYIYFE